MATAEAFLKFVSNLRADLRTVDESKYWYQSTFQLIKTKDFEYNWTLVHNPDGTFLDEDQKRCYIVPQKHLQSLYSGADASILYPAIVFGKLAYLHLLKGTDASEPIAAQPDIVRRTLFADIYLSIFPTHWKEIILKYNLEHYPEKKISDDESRTHGLYTALSEPQSFRLLALLPCEASRPFSDIRCLLGETSNVSDSYEALSYVWGDPTVTRPIRVNNQQISVTVNLEKALRTLRRIDGKPRVLWVDALCINQSDKHEKKQQVAQMDTIYKRAERVVVWLGSENSQSHKAFGYVEQLKQDFSIHEGVPSWLPQHFPFSHEAFCHECGAPPHDQTDLRSHKTFKKIYETVISPASPNMENVLNWTKHNPPVPRFLWDNQQAEIAEAFLDIISRPWWNRVWVLQEFALASKVILYCGARTVDWVLFRGILLTLVRIGQRSQLLSSSSPALQLQRRQFGLLTFRSFQVLPFILLSSINGSTYEAVRSFNPSLADLLALSRSSQASDPRDQIYALLGILAEKNTERLHVIPDYAQSVSEVYVHLTKYFLESSGTLDVLGCKRLAEHFLTSHGLPSWVPDWSTKHLTRDPSSTVSQTSFSSHSALTSLTQNFGSIPGDPSQREVVPQEPQHSHNIFCASLERKTHIPFSFYRDEIYSVLRLCGVGIGKIVYMGKPLMPHIQGKTEREIYDEFRDIIRSWKDECGVSDEIMYQSTGQTQAEAFWRTLFMDRCWEKADSETRLDKIKRLPRVLKDGFKTNLSGSDVQVTENFPPQTPADEEAIMKYLAHESGQRLTYNDTSCHCLSYAAFRTEEGYIGLCEPIARPGDMVAVLLGGTVPFVLRSFRGRYVFLGECYAHGVMDGEIIEQKCKDKSKEDVVYDAFEII